MPFGGYDEDDFNPSNFFTKGKQEKKADYSQPIAFVSSKKFVVGDRQLKDEEAEKEKAKSFLSKNIDDMIIEEDEEIIEEEDEAGVVPPQAQQQAEEEKSSTPPAAEETPANATNDFFRKFLTKKQEKPSTPQDTTSSSASPATSSAAEPAKKKIAYEVIQSKKTKQEQAQKEKEEDQPKRKILGKGASSSTDSQPQQANYQRDAEFGSFLQDNAAGKSVINMMKKMGYNFEGGLGAGGRGIVNPVKIVQVGKTAKFESDLQKPKEDQKEAAVEAKPKAWKKKPAAPKQKVVYKTAKEFADEVHSAQRKMQSQEVKRMNSLISTEELEKMQPKQQRKKTVDQIIDMRGPESRVIDKPLENFKAQTFSGSRKKVSKILPELQHNVQYLISMTEDEIKYTDERLQKEREKVKSLQVNQVKLKEDVAAQKKKMDDYEHVISVVRTCYQRIRQGSEDGLSVDELRKIFEKLQFEYNEMYNEYKISNAVAVLVAPLMRPEFDNWNPMERPKFNTTLIKQWRKLLVRPIKSKNQKKFNDDNMFARDDEEEEDQSQKYDEEDYSLMLEEVVLPKIRTSLVNDWSVRDAESAVTLLETWKQILPEAMTFHILDRYVLPKLKKAVEEWNPTEELIDTWVYPWLHLLGDKLELYNIFGIIRQKLVTVLQLWHPSDHSAIEIVTKWKQVFQAKEMDKLLTSSIVPKLIETLQNDLVIDPRKQDLSPVENVMAWYGVIPVTYLALCFEKSRFFSKWLSILYQWLCSPTPNVSEVTKWFNGWQSLFPEDLLEHQNKRLQSYFAFGMNMINQALAGKTIPNPDKMDTSAIPQAAATSAKAEASNAAPKPVFDEEELSFKDLVELFAVENDILFVPKENQTFEGKTLYSFGGITILIAYNSIYVRDAQKYWRAISIDDLLQMAKNKMK